jgi:hypothetical protein
MTVITTLPPPQKKARFSAPTTRRKKTVKTADFCVTDPHPYGILPLGNRLFDTHDSDSSSVLQPSRLLSDECWYNILEFCDGASLARVAQSCRSFYAFAHEPSLWRDLVLRSNHVIQKAGPSWKDCFVRMNNEKNDIFQMHRPMRVRNVYSDYFHRLHACRNFSIPPQWLEESKSDSISKIPYEQMTIALFESQFESMNKPVLMQNACQSWKAFDKWNDKDYLCDQTHGRTFRATSGTAPLPANISFAAYEEYCQSDSLEEGPVYLFDRTALEPGSILWKDYMYDLQRTCPYWDPERKDTFHDLFKVLGEGKRPDHTWLIVGPKRSGSVFHIDPNATHAWNATITGRKRWIFYPPGVTPPGVLPSANGDEVALPLSLGEWLLQFWDEHLKRGKFAPQNEKPIEFTAFPGDIVFVPHGYWHLVVNLDDRNVAITHNYCSQSNLKSVLKIIRDKNEQVSGCRDRSESIKPEQLYDEFVQKLNDSYPDLLEEALKDDAWACKAWTNDERRCTEAASLERSGAEQPEKASIFASARDNSTFAFGFTV